MTRNMLLSLLILTWFVTSLPVASRAGNANGQVLSFTTIASGEKSAVREPAQLVIRDRGAWRGLWQRHAGLARGRAPAVDFSREMVVAIFGGESAEPRRVTVIRITRDAVRLVVWYLDRPLKSPNGAGLPPQAPFHIVRLARSSLPVAFMRVKSFPPASQP